MCKKRNYVFMERSIFTGDIGRRHGLHDSLTVDRKLDFLVGDLRRSCLFWGTSMLMLVYIGDEELWTGVLVSMALENTIWLVKIYFNLVR